MEPATAQRLTKSLAALRAEGSLQGLVLDLRDNAGGLLSEAAQVADALLGGGSIAVVRGPAENEEKKAKANGSEPKCPIVVLINSVTASGSEMIASALQNNDRALVVGDTSFGMGRIQLVFGGIGPAAIKLTIAEFQAPAGTSIQGVGVVPDIQLRPVLLDRSETRFFKPFSRERDREVLGRFSSSGNRSQPTVTIRYSGAPDDPEFLPPDASTTPAPQSDFALQFAGQLVAQLKNGTRPQQLESVRAFLASARTREWNAILQRMQALGIDWQAPSGVRGSGTRRDDFIVRVDTDRAGHVAPAGGSMTLIVTVTNRSKQPAYRVRAITKSDNDDYADKELLFGYIGPGKSSTRRISLGTCVTSRAATPSQPRADGQRTCSLSPSPASREDVVQIRFSAEGGEAPPPAEIRPTVTTQSKLVSLPSSSAITLDVTPLALASRQMRVRVEGKAQSADGLSSVCAYVGERKAFCSFPESTASSLRFGSDVLLGPGTNTIHVVARDREGALSTRTMFTRRERER